MKSIDYQPIKKIDFASAAGKKRKIVEMLEDNCEEPQEQLPQEELVSDESFKYCTLSTDEELNELFNNISLADTKPSVLSLVEPYSDSYVPKSAQKTFPMPLKSLHNPSYIQLKYHELLKVCESVSLNFTQEMSELVEKETRSQFRFSLWYKYRAGTVTSSCMKSVCHTDPTNPAQSLVKSICYPEEFSKQTNWGQK